MRFSLLLTLLCAACGGSPDAAPPGTTPRPVRDEGHEWAIRGEEAFEQGRLPDAHAAYARALALWPADHRWRRLVEYKLAWTCYRMDRFPEALERFAVVADAPPEPPLADEAIEYLAIIVAEVDWDGDMREDARFGLARPEVVAWLARVSTRPWFARFDRALDTVCAQLSDQRPCARSRE